MLSDLELTAKKRKQKKIRFGSDLNHLHLKRSRGTGHGDLQ